MISVVCKRDLQEQACTNIQKVTFAMKDIFKLFCNSKMYFNH